MKWDGGAFKCANLGGGGGGRSLLETQPFACAVFCHLFFATCLMATLKFNSRGLLENHKFLHSFFSPYLHSVPFLFIPPLPLFTCSRPDGENKNCPANLATQPKFFFSPCSSSKLRSKLVDSLSDEHQHR